MHYYHTRGNNKINVVMDSYRRDVLERLKQLLRG